MNPFFRLRALFRRPRPREADIAAEKRAPIATVQDGRRFMWVETLVRDAGFAVRTLRKSPGFTSVVVLTLALGLGVNTALFTWFNAAAFRPLPVLDPGQLFTLTRLDANGSETRSMSYTD